MAQELLVFVLSFKIHTSKVTCETKSSTAASNPPRACGHNQTGADMQSTQAGRERGGEGGFNFHLVCMMSGGFVFTMNRKLMVVCSHHKV